mmetsp:Transcript_68017/g.199065  ORF Transcript_68017/g.199065 Transcript_68017/m.199065 type:complete len:304 (-) Transcript_68017:87-998(-)
MNSHFDSRGKLSLLPVFTPLNMEQKEAGKSMGVPLEAFTWTPKQARCIAQSQTGASNCGATALLNVLAALELPLPEIRSAEKAVHTNSRRYGVSVSKYLAARSVAGTTAKDIVAGCSSLMGGAVESRFFAFYPSRQVDLRSWLAGWISSGCSAVATLNTQRMYGADYWHHQMIFGVSAEGVSVTNGIEVLSFDDIALGLESPAALQIMAGDALRCSPFDAESCDAFGADWARMGVTQQLMDLKSSASKAGCVYIPAAYEAGITIFAKSGTPEAAMLQEAPELPLREESAAASDAGAGPLGVSG